jgi:hypothetical protein
MPDSDAEFLMKIANLLDQIPRKGEPEARTITLTDTFARELARGLRRIAQRLQNPNA